MSEEPSTRQRSRSGAATPLTRVEVGLANDTAPELDGDINLQIFGSCGSDAIAVSRSTSDSEEVSVQNVGNRPAFAIWQVYLYSDVRNNHNQTVRIR